MENLKRLCSICARGGSKGLPRKNILQLAGKPLIAHTIERALSLSIFHKVAVSSDSDEILNIAKELGVDFLIKRPDDLSSDTAPKIPAIRHCAQEVEEKTRMSFDTFVDLDCTSPLRTNQDILEAIALLEENNYDNIFSVTPARRSPYFDVVELDNKGKVVPCKRVEKEITRRQDAPSAYDLNASIYVWNRDTLMNSNSLYNERTGIYIMPNERSIEIDEEIDFIFTEVLMSRA